MSVNIVNAFFAAFSEVCEDFVVAYVGEEGEGGIKLMDAVPFVETGATLHRVIRQGELRMGMSDKDSFDDAYVYLEPATSNGPAKLRVYGSKAARVMDHPDQGAMVWDLEKSAARCYAVAKDTEDSKCFMLKGIVPWGPWGGNWGRLKCPPLFGARSCCKLGARLHFHKSERLCVWLARFGACLGHPAPGRS